MVGGPGVASNEYRDPTTLCAGDTRPSLSSEAARFSTDARAFSLFVVVGGVGGSSLVGGAEAAPLRALRDSVADSFLACRVGGLAVPGVHGEWGTSRRFILTGRIFLRRAGQGPSFHRSTEFRIAVLSTCWRQDWQYVLSWISTQSKCAHLSEHSMRSTAAWLQIAWSLVS